MPKVDVEHRFEVNLAESESFSTLDSPIALLKNRGVQTLLGVSVRRDVISCEPRL
jgi:hypothetical protein